MRERGGRNQAPGARPLVVLSGRLGLDERDARFRAEALVAVLGRAIGSASVRARGELEEIPVERRGPFWLIGEACVDRDRGSEGRLEELAVVVRPGGPLCVE
jgi:hypothetical protein